MTNTLNNLQEYSACNTPIRFGGNTKIAKAISVAVIKVVGPNGDTIVRLLETLYVLGLATNLISTEKLATKGCFYRNNKNVLFVFSKDGLNIQTPIANVFKRNGLPYLHTPTC